MARKPSPPTLRKADLSSAEVISAIPKIKRRISELEELDVSRLTNEDGKIVLASLVRKTNSTLSDIFDNESIEYNQYNIKYLFPLFGIVYPGTDVSVRGNLDKIHTLVRSNISKLNDLIFILEEKVEDTEVGSVSGAIRAYQGLELHPEIGRAASNLYKDGHYSNAIEAAVKALNGLVRLRSGLEQDGSSLMERAFAPSNPVLKFNSLTDQSDKDEQKGFMMMFSGAVAGLRNPRAHGFINDDPERALEFIAFVSLLAKLLDGATT
ncbi:TIGR02391 family protein [Methylobacterium sp. CM6247]